MRDGNGAEVLFWEVAMEGWWRWVDVLIRLLFCSGFYRFLLLFSRHGFLSTEGVSASGKCQNQVISIMLQSSICELDIRSQDK